MRTTIEIDDEKMALLRKLAAERGQRGYSRLIDEALEDYLGRSHGQESARRTRIATALALRRAWSEEDAEAVRQRIKDSRKHWR